MRDSDEVAFTAFVQGRWSALYRTAYLLTGERGEAEDLVQTALASTYVAWPRIRDRGAIEAYVRRAMVNAASRGWRKRGRTVLVEEPSMPSHDSGLSGLEERAQVWAAVCALPPRMRATLVLRYYEDLPEAEVAAALDCSVGSVKSQTHHALKRLRDALGGTRTSFLEETR